MRVVVFRNWTQHDKINKITCAPSENSDQPGHLPSLTRVWRNPGSLAIHWAHRAKTLIRLRGCVGWSDSSLGAHTFLLVLSCCGSFLVLLFSGVSSVFTDVGGGTGVSTCRRCEYERKWHASTYIHKNERGWLKTQMSRDTTKPTKWVCAQRRLRSAWVSAQSDQSLRYALDPSLFHAVRTLTLLVLLCSGSNSDYWFRLKEMLF